MNRSRNTLLGILIITMGWLTACDLTPEEQVDFVAAPPNVEFRFNGSDVFTFVDTLPIRLTVDLIANPATEPIVVAYNASGDFTASGSAEIPAGAKSTVIQVPAPTAGSDTLQAVFSITAVSGGNEVYQIGRNNRGDRVTVFVRP